MSEWMSDSGYQVADGLAIELYGTDFVMDEKTGAFNCFAVHAGQADVRC